jgi:ABC-type transport system involved in multi-copper enzyme maturation permease subunit
MFKALMKVQWKWTRLAVLIATVLGFSIPMGTARIFDPRDFMTGRISPAYVIRAMQQAGVLYAILAGAIGLFVAFLAWNADQKGRHVYALSLPVSRARFALMRFGAGATFLLVPALGVLIGCLLATAIIEIPQGMKAYPVAVAMRFLLSSFVAFAIFFAVAASSQKAAAIALGSLAGFFLLAVIVSAMGLQTDLIELASGWIFAEPGVLSIFTGRWMLVDV